MTWSVGRPFQGEIFSDSNQRESFGGWLGRVKSDQLQMLRTTRTEDRRLGASPPYVEKNRWHETKGKLPLKIYQFVRKENEKDIYMKCGSSHPSFSSNWQVKLSVKSDQAGLSLEKMCSTDWSKIARKCVWRKIKDCTNRLVVLARCSSCFSSEQRWPMIPFGLICLPIRDCTTRLVTPATVERIISSKPSTHDTALYI